MKETPRSSTTSVDISVRGIDGQDDNINFTVNSKDNDDTSNIRGKNKTMKMILLTQCFAGWVSIFFKKNFFDFIINLYNYF